VDAPRWFGQQSGLLQDWLRVGIEEPPATSERRAQKSWEPYLEAFAHALGIASNLEAWRECGLDTNLFEPYKAAEAHCDWAETARLVWNTNAHRDFALCGTHEELAEQIQQKTELLGLDLPVLSVCAHNERQILETLEGGRLYAEQG
jgi:alkanesulfonate monooxygenase SsuD/methylene tetrahydromethanopterin reductase-like flavin-dependent oxidoreductase (luciferase family)